MSYCFTCQLWGEYILGASVVNKLHALEAADCFPDCCVQHGLRSLLPENVQRLANSV